MFNGCDPKVKGSFRVAQQPARLETSPEQVIVFQDVNVSQEKSSQFVLKTN